MAEEIVAGSIDFPLKRPREDEEDGVSGASTVSMETNTDKEHDCVSAVIPGWFSEISPNVFRFGTLMATTFEWQGILAYAIVIGIAQGIRAAIGIATTIVIDF